MTAAGFRKLALKMPEATEGSHFGVADFRAANKIFATLAYEKSGSGVLMLTPEQQEGMVADAPDIFSPVPNAWGRQGATNALTTSNATPAGSTRIAATRTAVPMEIRCVCAAAHNKVINGSSHGVSAGHVIRPLAA